MVGIADQDGPDEAASPAGLSFYTSLPTHDDFASLGSPATYTPLPAGWIVGLADIVQSSRAVEAGRYKSVNTVAASVIAALSNAIGETDYPFVFGGDGASFALPGSLREPATAALASVAIWAGRDLGFDLRTGLVAIETIRAAGHDVRLARYAPSPDVAYAMFAGGGLAFAEERLKAGDYALEPPATVPPPDLSGLSCRFDEVPSRHGTILSLIAVPRPDAPPGTFGRLLREVLAIAEEAQLAARPLPPEGPRHAWIPGGEAVRVEAEAARASAGGAGSRLFWRLRTAARLLAAAGVFRLRQRVGRFDPETYLRQLSANADFRKFDDGLRMTLDLDPEAAARLESALETAEAAGIAEVGTHRQGASLITCFVPSPTRADHVHFVDGAEGGYAAAAAELKRKRLARA